MVCADSVGAQLLIEDLRRQNEDYRATLGQQTEDLVSVRQELSLVSGKLTAVETEKDSLEQKLRTVEEASKQQISDFEKRLESELQDHQLALGDAEAHREVLEDQLGNAIAEIDALKEVQQECLDLETEVVHLKEKNELLVTNFQSLEEEQALLRKTLAGKDERIKALEIDNSEAAHKLAALMDDLQHAEVQYRKLSEKLQTSEKENSQKEAELVRLSDQLDAVSDERSVLAETLQKTQADMKHFQQTQMEKEDVWNSERAALQDELVKATEATGRAQRDIHNLQTEKKELGIALRDAEQGRGEITRELQETQKLLVSSEEKLERTAAELSEAREELLFSLQSSDALKEALAEAEQRIEEAGTKEIQHSSIIDDLTSKAGSLEEEVKLAREELEVSRLANTELRHKFDAAEGSLKQQLRTLQEELLETERQRTDAETTNEDLKSEFENREKELSASIEELRSSAAKTENALQDCKIRLEMETSAHETTRNIVAALELSASEMRSELQKSQEIRDAITVKLSRAERALEVAHRESQTALEAAAAELASSQREISKTQKVLGEKESELQETKVLLDTLEQQNAQLKSEIQKTETDKQALRKQLQERERQLSLLETCLQESQERAAQAEFSLSVAQESARETQVALELKQSELERAASELEAQEADFDALKQDIRRSEGSWASEREEMEARLQSARAALDDQRNESQHLARDHEAAKVEVTALRAEVSAAKEEFHQREKKFQSSLETLQREKAKREQELLSEIGSKEAQLRDVRTLLAASEQRISALDREVDALKAQLDGMADDLAAKDVEVQQKSQELERMNESLDQEKARFTASQLEFAAWKGTAIAERREASEKLAETEKELQEAEAELKLVSQDKESLESELLQQVRDSQTENAELRKSLGSLGEELLSAQRDRAEFQQQASAAEAECSRLRQTLHEVERDNLRLVGEHQSASETLQLTVQRLEAREAMLRKDLDSAISGSNTLREELEEAVAERTSLKTRLEETEMTSTDAQKACGQLEKELSALSGRFTAETEKLSAELAAKESLLERTKQDLQNTEARWESLMSNKDATVAELQTKLAESEESLQAAEIQNVKLSEELDALRRDLGSLQAELKTVTLSRDEDSARMGVELRRTQKEAQETIDSKNAELESLASALRELAGKHEMLQQTNSELGTRLRGSEEETDRLRHEKSEIAMRLRGKSEELAVVREEQEAARAQVLRHAAEISELQARTDVLVTEKQTLEARLLGEQTLLAEMEAFRAESKASSDRSEAELLAIRAELKKTEEVAKSLHDKLKSAEEQITGLTAEWNSEIAAHQKTRQELEQQSGCFQAQISELRDLLEEEQKFTALHSSLKDEMLRKEEQHRMELSNAAREKELQLASLESEWGERCHALHIELQETRARCDAIHSELEERKKEALVNTEDSRRLREDLRRSEQTTDKQLSSELRLRAEMEACRAEFECKLAMIQEASIKSIAQLTQSHRKMMQACTKDRVRLENTRLELFHARLSLQLLKKQQLKLPSCAAQARKTEASRRSRWFGRKKSGEGSNHLEHQAVINSAVGATSFESSRERQLSKQLEETLGLLQSVLPRFMKLRSRFQALVSKSKKVALRVQGCHDCGDCRPELRVLRDLEHQPQSFMAIRLSAPQTQDVQRQGKRGAKKLKKNGFEAVEQGFRLRTGDEVVGSPLCVRQSHQSPLSHLLREEYCNPASSEECKSNF